MGSITNYLEAKWLDHICGTSYSSPANIYLALCTADPTDAATGASCGEVANQYGYARTAISFGTAASRVVDQDAPVNFPQASGGGWGTVSHWCILDNNGYGTGNALAHGAFGTGKAVNDGDTPSVATGEIDVTVSANEVSTYVANELLDHTFNNSAYTAPSTYVALCTTDVVDSDAGSDIDEPAGGAYARKQVNNNGGAAPDWDLAVEGDPSYVDSADDIEFAQATGDWGTIVAMAICDSGTTGGGQVLMYDNDMTDKPVNSGDTAKFSAAALVLQMS